MSEAQKRAKKKYQKNITRLTIDFYPTEKELVEQIEKQPKKQTYIKDLIREDLEREKKHGRWILLRDDIGRVSYYECPFCRTIYAYAKEMRTLPDKCEDCGAIMDK